MMPGLEGARAEFWIIWNPAGRNPTFRHRSEIAAVREAERLAASNPGQTFVVMHSRCARRCGEMERIDLSRPEDDDVPF